MGGSLNCCCTVCMCLGGVCVGVIVWVCGCDCVGGCECDCVGVGMIAWVWKGVCGWYSLNCCCKVCMCVKGGRGEGGGREGGREGGVCVWV